MQKRLYKKELLNKLLVVHKPMFISSNSYLNRIKRKYQNKKAGFSGTLDPFACGCLIVAFGQYAKLFKYLKKTPKTYRAVIWLGTQSESLDIENINSIKEHKKLDASLVQQKVEALVGEHTYTPPKFSAKKINGQRAYDLARKGEEVALKQAVMTIIKSRFVHYNHPFITFEAEVSEGSYIRSLAQILLEQLDSIGTLSYLQRLNEGAFFYQNEKSLNPLAYLDLKENTYSGDQSYFENGKTISVDYLSNKEEGSYIVKFEEFFSIIQIKDDEVSYLLNKVQIQ